MGSSLGFAVNCRWTGSIFVVFGLRKLYREFQYAARSATATIRREVANMRNRLDGGGGEGRGVMLCALSLSLLKRFRSERNSAALWYRTSRSFSSALLMIRSSSGDSLGLKCVRETGAVFRIAEKIIPAVSPSNGRLLATI